MRTILFVLMLSIGVIASSHAADDVLANLQFSDGISRTQNDFAGQNVVIIHFCGHCPGSRGALTGDYKKEADWANAEHISAWVIAITPDLDPAALEALKKEAGLESMLLAFDSSNRMDISTKNTLQFELISADGTLSRPRERKLQDTITAAEAKQASKPLIIVDGLTDENIITAWWAFERGTPGALKALVGVSKRKGHIQEQAQAIVTSAQTYFDAETAHVSDDLAGFERLEFMITRFDGLDTKTAKTKAVALAKDAALKPEIKARDLYRKCQAMIASNRTKDQEQGKAGMGQIAEAMPDTVYGKKAAAAATSAK